MSVTDISTRRPFNPNKGTQCIIEHLREMAEEIERGDYGQLDIGLVALRNADHTYLSRMNQVDERMWIDLSSSIAVAIRERKFK